MVKIRYVAILTYPPMRVSGNLDSTPDLRLVSCKAAFQPNCQGPNFLGRQFIKLYCVRVLLGCARWLALQHPEASRCPLEHSPRNSVSASPPRIFRFVQQWSFCSGRVAGASLPRY